MKKYNHNLSDLLKEWGREKRQKPANPEILKNKAFTALRTPEKVSVQKPNRFLWLALTSSALVVVLFFSGSMLHKNRSTEYYPVSGCGGDLCNLSASIDGTDDFNLNKITTESVDFGKEVVDTLSGIVDYVKKPSITDTREFLKTDYGAVLRTRKVEKLNTRIQTMIRGYGGRVDSSSVDQENSQISFIIPKSSLDIFRLELKDLVPARFLTENMSTQNLLPQKQGIENQTEVTNQNLSDLQVEREQLVKQHTSRAASLQQQINNYARSIAALKNEVTTDTARQEEISKQISSGTNQQYSVKQALNIENSHYKASLQKIDSDIATANSRLLNLNVQDQDLLNNVETVEGSISLQWISIFDIINLYIPIYWISVISCIVIIVVYLLYGRRRSFELP